ncbi:MAG: hypothetical protein ACRBDL_02645 [Alphaproteobacteria bacterium]
MDIKHYNQKPKRNAEFIKPPNVLKAKVGYGGLSNQILDRTQSLLENHAADFSPLADIYLDRMKKALDEARERAESTESEEQIALVLLPCVQLKANGAMFHFPLITRVAERFVQFMEVVERLDNETLDIALAFYNTLKIIAAGKIKGDGGMQGDALVEELNSACMRYFEKHKDYIETKQDQE